MTLCEAIAKVEGFGANALNRPTRNNNPGDIEYGVFAMSHGATGIEATRPGMTPRFAVFPDATVGFNAMRALLLKHYAGLTVEQAINKYAPPVENQTNNYVALVCLWAACKPSDVIDNLL